MELDVLVAAASLAAGSTVATGKSSFTLPYSFYWRPLSSER